MYRQPTLSHYGCYVHLAKYPQVARTESARCGESRRHHVSLFFRIDGAADSFPGFLSFGLLTLKSWTKILDHNILSILDVRKRRSG
jgi:hypothetical protein